MKSRERAKSGIDESASQKGDISASISTIERAARPLHLRAGGTSVLLRFREHTVPEMIYWGAELGELSDEELNSIEASFTPQRLAGGLDDPQLCNLVPMPSSGWAGTPGLAGHRNGSTFSPKFALRSATHLVSDTGESSVTIKCDDAASELSMAIELQLLASGLVRQKLTVVNEGSAVYDVLHLEAGFTVPSSANEVFDLTGRWSRERAPQRHLLTAGEYVREARRGRPGADATVLLAVGNAGFGFEGGKVWGLHVAWSGNSRAAVTQTNLGEVRLAGGELLLPGEVRLKADESYSSPWIYGAWGDGLDALSHRFHSHLRTVKGAPSVRPVTLNTWEAVYFDHNFDKLALLATLAAGVGVERFVLDDGWFSERRSDEAGLGNWTVDADIWPQGLTPLIDHVRSLGMEFGLWVEPEMVNRNSEILRIHPEWMLKAGPRIPAYSRQQQGLNLAIPEAFDAVYGMLHELLEQHDIGYLKWDHNRDILEPGDASTGHAAMHEQTLAAYRLIDLLRQAHPSVEIENCASGAARLDLMMLERTDRIWPSDCIDALERIQIQKYSGLLVPLEMMGAHIGSPVAHTTGRTVGLDLAGATAFFGHLGIEWDLTETTAAERERLGEWVTAYKRHRELIHTGLVINVDDHDDSVSIHGVVATTADEAIFSFTQLVPGVFPTSGRIRIPGLAPHLIFEVSLLPPGDVIRSSAQSESAIQRPMIASGTVLQEIGLPAPAINAGESILLHARRISATRSD